MGSSKSKESKRCPVKQMIRFLDFSTSHDGTEYRKQKSGLTGQNKTEKKNPKQGKEVKHGNKQ